MDIFKLTLWPEKLFAPYWVEDYFSVNWRNCWKSFDIAEEEVEVYLESLKVEPF